MLGVIAELSIQDGKVDEAIGLIKTLMAEVAKEEGTLGYTMNRDPSNPNVIIIMERYKDKAALDHHSSAAYFTSFLGQIQGILAGKPEIRVMEEIHSI